MSEVDQKEANLAIQEFTNRVRSVERITIAQSMIDSLDTVPEDLRSQATSVFTRMIESLDQ